MKDISQANEWYYSSYLVSQRGVRKDSTSCRIKKAVMWESGALAIGRSQFLRNLGVLLNTFSNLCDDFENSSTGGVVPAGAPF